MFNIRSRMPKILTDGPHRSRRSRSNSLASNASSESSSRGSSQEHREGEPPFGGSHKSLLLFAASQEASTYLPAIKAMQNRFLEPETKAHKLIGLVSDAVKRMPEKLDRQALAKLNFTSKKRSKELIGMLIDLKLAANFIKMRQFDSEVERTIALLGAASEMKNRPMSERESRGVRIYLNGVRENLLDLGKDIAKLPVQERPSWAFYSGQAITRDESQSWMNFFRSHGVVDNQYLPANGSQSFDIAKATFLHKIINSSRAEFVPHYDRAVEALRDVLFPLPAYIDAPPYQK